MKTTMDLPDDLYRRVKAKSALEGRPVREVTIDLYRQWLAERPAADASADPAERLSAWLDLADDAARRAPDGPTARDQLTEGRTRLERR